MPKFLSLAEYSEQGGEAPCEDFTRVTPTSLAVVDGATSLGDGAPTVAFSRGIATHLVQELDAGVRGVAAYTNAVRRAVGATEHDFNGASASAAAAHLHEGHLSISCIGDCTVLVRYTNGNVVKFCDNKVRRVDDLAKGHLVSTAARIGVTPREARPHIQSVLQANRSMINTPSGYWALDPTCSGVREGVHEVSLRIDAVTEVAVFSDGLGAALELGIRSAETLLDSLRNGDVQHVCAEIRATLDEDEDYVMYPRFKHVDDMSAAYGLLNGKQD